MNNEAAVKSNGSKIIVWIIKLGLLVVPVLPLVVTRSLFFPFITGRNFIFRIIIEIIFVFWLWLMMTDPSYRPKVSPILYAVIAFVVVLFLATIFGISPYKSFWSSFERMEGFWGHWHYFLYFLMLGSIFQSKSDWKGFSGISLGMSAVVSLYALLQLLGKLDVHQGDVRLDATMGNATYLAIYLVLHVFLLLYFFSGLKQKNRWLSLGFLALAVFELFIVYRTATRGAMLGFLAGLAVMVLVNSLWNRGRARSLGLTALVVIIVVPILFLAVKNSQFVKESEVLSRFASISLNETTTQSRFIIWNMAFEAWKDRPVLGWGQESFVYIFSKYFDARLWRQEPWFDRAHNVFLDWLTSAGIVGLIAYLALFGSVFLVLWRLFKKKEIDVSVLGLFSGMLVAYLIHNVFVFDNFTSYIIFFALLAFWHSRHVQSVLSRSSGSAVSLPINIRAPVLIVTALAMAFSVYTFNVKPIRASQSILNALSLVTYSRDGSRIRDLGEGIKALKKGVDYNTFGTSEIREQLAQYAERINRDPVTSDEDKEKFLDFAVDQLKMQERDFPYDVRAKAFLSTLNGEIGDYAGAVAIAREGLAVSDQRQQFYFLLAEAYFKAGEENLAVGAVKQAYELAPEYPEAIHNYAVMLIFSGHPAEAEALLKKHFGTEIYPDPKYVNAYAALGDFRKVARVWEALVAQDTKNLQYRLSLASIYTKLGEPVKAIAEINKAIGIWPSFKDQGETLIEQIGTGRFGR